MTAPAPRASDLGVSVLPGEGTAAVQRRGQDLVVGPRLAVDGRLQVKGRLGPAREGGGDALVAVEDGHADGPGGRGDGVPATGVLHVDDVLLIGRSGIGPAEPGATSPRPGSPGRYDQTAGSVPQRVGGAVQSPGAPS